MTEQHLVLQLTTIEVAQLRDLVTQFAALIAESGEPGDASLDRLAPDAYPDDADAAGEFRRLTRGDLLDRRRDDAEAVLSTLDPTSSVPPMTAIDDDVAALPRIVSLAPDEVQAWMRTLAAVRLVLASRLGIEGEDDHDLGDSRYMLYDWVGVILDAIVRTIDD